MHGGAWILRSEAMLLVFSEGGVDNVVPAPTTTPFRQQASLQHARARRASRREILSHLVSSGRARGGGGVPEQGQVRAVHRHASGGQAYLTQPRNTHRHSAGALASPYAAETGSGARAEALGSAGGRRRAKVLPRSQLQLRFPACEPPGYAGHLGRAKRGSNAATRDSGGTQDFAPTEDSKSLRGCSSLATRCLLAGYTPEGNLFDILVQWSGDDTEDLA